MDGEITSARDLWERLAAMSQDERLRYLDEHEVLVDGEWRRCNNADVLRNRNTPLLLYTDWPGGEHAVPMDGDVSVRRAP